jgi:hypothetical protein
VASLFACTSDPRKGYAFSSLADRPASTVRVDMFRNNTFTPGLEQHLTEAIIKHVQSETPMRVVQGPQAQSTLTGVITDVQLRSMSRDPTTGLVQELAVQITVDFDWKDARGQTLVARRRYAATDTFVPAGATREVIETGEHAAVERLARDLVHELRAAW